MLYSYSISCFIPQELKGSNSPLFFGELNLTVFDINPLTNKPYIEAQRVYDWASRVIGRSIREMHGQSLEDFVQDFFVYILKVDYKSKIPAELFIHIYLKYFILYKLDSFKAKKKKSESVSDLVEEGVMQSKLEISLYFIDPSNFLETKEYIKSFREHNTKEAKYFGQGIRQAPIGFALHNIIFESHMDIRDFEHAVEL